VSIKYLPNESIQREPEQMNYETTIMPGDDQQGLLASDAVGKKRGIIFAVITALLIAAAAYFFIRNSGDKNAASGDADKKAQAQTVSVIAPGRETIVRAINATGTLAARREIPVGVVGEGGQVSRVFVDAGDWVQQGQVLVSIERSVQVQQMAGLDAQISVARADLQLAQNCGTRIYIQGRC
jgi:HlyD family secretion protein